MEALINHQKLVIQRLERAFSNYKKSPKDRITTGYVQSKIDMLLEMWKDFVTGDQKITICDPKYLDGIDYITKGTFDQTQELFVEYRTLLYDDLTKLNKVEQQHVLSPMLTENSKNNLIKLPRISIPKFSGKYVEWSTFKDLFKSMIHNNDSLDDVQKLHYLKSFLTGEAEQLLRHIPITADNYSECWNLLESRYNNKKYLSHCILKRLLSQRNATIESATYLKELIDTSTECLNALSNLGIDISTWDIIVIHILTLKLDFESRKQWELNITTNIPADQLPTFKQFKEFITSRYRALEFVGQKNFSRPHQPDQISKSNTFHNTDEEVSSSAQCPLCSESHYLHLCKQFMKLENNARREFVQNNRLCFNCFGNHSAKNCKSSQRCKVCKRAHNSLLHYNNNRATTVATATEEVEEDYLDENEPEQVSSNTVEVKSPFVLLATALVTAETNNGNDCVVRALIDQGSQASFVTEATVQLLRLRKVPVKGVISGVGGGKQVNSNGVVYLNLKSMVEPNIKIRVKAHVLKSITGILPNKRISELNWIQNAGIKLADPEYYVPNKIDILLGAEIYSQILKEGIMKDPTGLIVTQSTAFGWIVSGLTNDSESTNFVVMHASALEDEMFKKFWELESDTNLTKEQELTEEEKRCEEIFKTTTERDEEGRYVVRLPFKTDDPECTKGDSRSIAEKRLIGLNYRLNKDIKLKRQYTEVIEEYLLLGHMEEVKKPDNKNDKVVYLPHHAVVKEDRETTKVRVVFNASQKGKNGVSLNDTLLVGPRIQPELRHLVMRWRLPVICLTADIVKMYRQVKVNHKDADFQRILWKDNEEIKDFKLNRVTFGTASAPFLAVRTLQQVAYDEGSRYPLAANRVIQDFYMDDLMTGCETIQEGFEIYKQMNGLLSKAGFTLQKWSCNNNDLLNMMKEENGRNEIQEKNELKLKTDDVIKILGLIWVRSCDKFCYVVKLPALCPPITKRKIVSDISKLYDPLGWITPCIIVAKTMIQKLWLTGIEWDEEVPKELLSEWFTYRSELVNLSEVFIPRSIGIKQNDLKMELHGFCDASKIAYAAVVYSRRIDVEGVVHVSLITAKSKVAPIKQVSIPRLELCAAVLLAKLMLEVARVLNIEKNKLYAWTDSAIVLAWLNKHPNRWNIFVANRVSEIMTLLEPKQWSHVSTKHNPADCASRGLTPVEIKDNKLWFQGPPFLLEKEIKYVKPQNLTTELEAVQIHQVTIEDDFWERFSSLTRLIRVIAYCRRFFRKSGSEPRTGYLKQEELEEASETIIRKCQGKEFKEEIGYLKNINTVKRTSAIRILNPYLDEKYILRVGGRLENASLGSHRTHPIIIPKKSHLAKLIVADAHRQTLHGGTQLTLNYINSKYYVMGAKQLVKAHIKKCVVCVKNAGITHNQLMGQLPVARVTPSRPFLYSGVDFAGPIQIRTAKGRSHRSYKGYICLFICMATRAVHIEAVTSLSTQGFLEAFKRFVSRRGCCQQIWSDNGTNFVGAARELRTQLLSEKGDLKPELAECLANNGTTWHFIPPHAPNFGGLWEAGIKSVKFHLKRVIGDSSLTYEELSTVLVQIEACLNSRPLSRLENEPDQNIVLTPGHFLIGEPLVVAPDYSYEHSNVGSLKRWQYCQRMLQEFWRKWSQEYLTQFLRRYRWSDITSQPKVNDVVLVKEDGLSPAKWLYGKVVEVHPGRDNIVRVVSLKTKNSIIRRPTSKLCVLPISD